MQGNPSFKQYLKKKADNVECKGALFDARLASVVMRWRKCKNVRKSTPYLFIFYCCRKSVKHDRPGECITVLAD